MNPKQTIVALVGPYHDDVPRPKRVFRIKNNTIVMIEKQHEEEPSDTYVMRWNPDISSYSMDDFEDEMDCIMDEGRTITWSIWDYRDVKIGDRFFLLKVGSGTTGIVMEGTIVSLPYRGEDWSGRGREVYYVRMKPNCIIHPDRTDHLITTEALSRHITTVNWNEGHSGEKLERKEAKMLSALWEDHLLHTDMD